MKKFLLFVLSAMILSACAIPLASVKVRQALPVALPNGCHYVDQGGTGDSGNYAYINGYAYDPGTFFVQVATGNSMMVAACAETNLLATYGDMYKQFVLSNFPQEQNKSDGKLKDELKKTRGAMVELENNVMDLGALFAASQGGTKGKAPASGKPGKGAKQETETSAPAPSPESTPAVQQPQKPAPIDPSIVGRVRAAHYNSDLIGILRVAARDDSTNAAMYNTIADRVSQTQESDFTNNQATLIGVFSR